MDAVKKSMPMRLLKQIKTQYPGVFDLLDEFRYDKSLDDVWPHGQIFVPVAGVAALFSNSEGIQDVKLYQDMETVVALAGWRQQKNIYAFDTGAAQAVYDDAGEHTIDDVKLLDWSMYIQPNCGEMMPGVGNELDGFFAYWDLDKDIYELRFLPVGKQRQLFPVMALSLPRFGNMTITEAVAQSADRADDVYEPEFLRTHLEHWVKLILFLASEGAVLVPDEEHVYKEAKTVLYDTPQEVKYVHVRKK